MPASAATRSRCWRGVPMLVGVVGTYRKNESVDVEYTLRGETKLVSDVAILPG